MDPNKIDSVVDRSEPRSVESLCLRTSVSEFWNEITCEPASLWLLFTLAVLVTVQFPP